MHKVNNTTTTRSVISIWLHVTSSALTLKEAIHLLPYFLLSFFTYRNYVRKVQDGKLALNNLNSIVTSISRLFYCWIVTKSTTFTFLGCERYPRFMPTMPTSTSIT